jgi:NAD+ diphosphatase
MVNAASYGVYLFQKDALLVRNDVPDSRIEEPLPFEQVTAAFGMVAQVCFELPALGEAHAPIKAADLPATAAVPALWRVIPMRQALSLMAHGATADGQGAVGRLLRAYHVAQWRRDSAFCGTCGSRNTDAPDELARLCPVCGRREYPRISPAIIVIIINDEGQALLAHNRSFTKRVYSLIAGFNEAGESLEATVTREVWEEVGITVKDVRYITSQPWPFPNSLMLGFTARHAGGSITVDGVEIEDARWFNRSDLPELPGAGSVSRYLINQWLAAALP